MSKRPSDAPVAGNGKVARLDGPVGGVVKKTGPRLPVIMYREGEALNEIVEFLTGDDGKPQSVEVRIPGQFVTSNNRQVRSRQLWGSDIYTSDSDLVAVLMHYGYIYHTISQPLKDVTEVRAVVRPLPAQASYASSPRNSIRSRAWSSTAPGCAYCVEKAWVVTRTGNSYDLQPAVDGIPAAAATFAPTHFERMLTRSAAGPASKQRQVQEVTAVFNLVNEPWSKYTMASVCDRGLKPHDRTSARLQTHVLYLESYTTRYEVSRVGITEGSERFRFARCKKALSGRAMRAAGVPLPEAEREVLHDAVQWEEMEWSHNSVVIRGDKYPLVRIHFVSIEASEESGDDDGHNTRAAKGA